MPESDDSLLVVTTLPDAASAGRLADALVARRLAACVSQLAPCRSTYRWQDEIRHDDEVPLLIKTRGDRYAELEAAIRELHPYEVPEIVALAVARGLPAYLDWLVAETRPE